MSFLHHLPEGFRPLVFLFFLHRPNPTSGWSSDATTKATVCPLVFSTDVIAKVKESIFS